MTSAFEPIIKEMLAEIQKQHDDLVRLRREIPEISGSARSKRRQVSATVDARGEIVELKFHGAGYRSLAPAELADIIVQTIRDARADAKRQVRDVIGDAVPEGLDFLDATAADDFDWNELIAPPKPFLDLLQPPEPPVREVPEGLGGVPVIDPEPARSDEERGGRG